METRTITIQSSLIFIFSLLALALTLSSCTKDDDNGINDDDDDDIEYVEFVDPDLELVVVGALGKDSGPISTVEILELTDLNINGSTFTSLQGLQYAENLEKLEARSLGVESLATLSEIPSLRYLDLRNTLVPNEDLSFLDGITGLTYLDLRGTGLSDISNLSVLTQLEELYLRDNAISDLSPLSGLTTLTYLNIHSNILITELTPLAGLENLEVLIMRNVPAGDNEMEVIRNFPNLWRINARNTGITDLTVFGDVMAQGALQDRPDEGVSADVDIRENEFGEVTESDDPYAPIRPYWENISSRSPELLPAPVGDASVFEDAALESAVRNALGIGPEDEITDQMLIGLEELDARDLPIESIEGIEKMPNLTFLRLDGTNLTDISPLEALSQLNYFNINTTTGITDISPLRNNTQLGTLIARNVPFGNEGMNTIANFTQLHRLNMRNTGVTDLSVLANLMSQGALQNENAPNNTAILDIRQIDAEDFCVIYPYIGNIADLDGGDFSDCE